jgi:uncharacterized protein YdeI (YjbR/CyaY-like superfamily)
MPEYKTPSDLSKALRSDKKVKTLWESLTPIAKRDFITWIESAKQPETRVRRIGITCDKLVSGKRRPCCYAVVPMGLYKALGENPKAKAVWKNLSSDKRRDYADFVDKTTTKETKAIKIEKVIKTLEKTK